MQNKSYAIANSGHNEIDSNTFSSTATEDQPNEHSLNGHSSQVRHEILFQLFGSWDDKISKSSNASTGAANDEPDIGDIN